MLNSFCAVEKLKLLCSVSCRFAVTCILDIVANRCLHTTCRFNEVKAETLDFTGLKPISIC